METQEHGLQEQFTDLFIFALVLTQKGKVVQLFSNIGMVLSQNLPTRKRFNQKIKEDNKTQELDNHTTKPNNTIIHLR